MSITLLEFWKLCWISHVRNEKFFFFSGRQKHKKSHTLFWLPSENRNYQIINSFMPLLVLLWLIHFLYTTFHSCCYQNNVFTFISFCQCTVPTCTELLWGFVLLLFFYSLSLSFSCSWKFRVYFVCHFGLSQHFFLLSRLYLCFAA